MKKFLLIAAVAVTMFSTPVAQAAEGDETVFGYINDWPVSDFPIKWSGWEIVGAEIGGAMYLGDDVVKEFNGYKLTKVHIVSGSTSRDAEVNSFNDVELIFRRELDGRSFYHQGIMFGTEPKVWNTFQLETPVEVSEDDPFYVGYVGVVTAANSKPIVYSGYKKEPNSPGCWVLTPYEGWQNYSDFYGDLMMEVSLLPPGGSENDVVTIQAGKENQAVAERGVIRLLGSFDNAKVFDLKGNLVAEASTTTSLPVSAGLYIVRFNDKTSQKLFVK